MDALALSVLTVYHSFACSSCRFFESQQPVPYYSPRKRWASSF